MSDDERIEQLELENKVLQENNKGLKAKIDELQKENQELKENYDKLSKHFIENHISKEKIREIIYPSPDNMIPLEVQTSDMYMKLKNLVEE